jgi:regulator of cell morphogenesis and NO signaling
MGTLHAKMKMEDPQNTRTEWQKYKSFLGEDQATKKGIDMDVSKNEGVLNSEFFDRLVTVFASEEELPIDQLKRFPIPVILAYLEKTHAAYLTIKLMEMEQSILNLHERIPENALLPFLVSFFAWVQENLLFHIKMEEEQLFPYIRSLSAGIPENTSFSIQSFLEHHTDTIELQLKEVKKHIVRAQLLTTELFPFRLLLAQLDEFERDLRKHARIEDEVLVPLALELENKWARS